MLYITARLMHPSRSYQACTHPSTHSFAFCYANPQPFGAKLKALNNSLLLPSRIQRMKYYIFFNINFFLIYVNYFFSFKFLKINIYYASSSSSSLKSFRQSIQLERQSGKASAKMTALEM